MSRKPLPFSITGFISGGHASATKASQKENRQTSFWFTEAGGATYFGNAMPMPSSEARNFVNDHIKSLSEGTRDSKAKVRTAADLMDLFLDNMSTVQ